MQSKFFICYAFICVFVYEWFALYLVSLFGYDPIQEVDPTVEHEDMGGENGMDSLVSELANAIPGIDEAMSFAEMLK